MGLEPYGCADYWAQANQRGGRARYHAKRVLAPTMAHRRRYVHHLLLPPVSGALSRSDSPHGKRFQRRFLIGRQIDRRRAIAAVNCRLRIFTNASALSVLHGPRGEKFGLIGVQRLFERLLMRDFARH